MIIYMPMLEAHLQMKLKIIDRTSCYSIVLLMKDDVIDEVILDLPTAG